MTKIKDAKVTKLQVNYTEGIQLYNKPPNNIKNTNRSVYYNSENFVSGKKSTVASVCYETRDRKKMAV